MYLLQVSTKEKQTKGSDVLLAPSAATEAEALPRLASPGGEFQETDDCTVIH